MKHQFTMDSVLLDRMVFCLYSNEIGPLSQNEFNEVKSRLKRECLIPSWLTRLFNHNNTPKKNKPLKYKIHRLSYNKNLKMANLTINVHINPTRILAHELRSTQKTPSKKRSLDGNDNYLGIEWWLVNSPDNPHSRCFEIVAKSLLGLQSEITQIIGYGDVNSKLFKPHWSLQQVEFYWDVFQNNAIAAIYEMEDSFRTTFRDFEKSYYNFPITSIGVDRTAPCLKGSCRAQELFKLYAKLYNTLRFEANIGKNAIRSACGTNVIKHFNQRSLENLFQPIITNLNDKWSKLIFPSSNGIDINEGISDLYEIAHSFTRHKNLFINIINELMRNGRIVSRDELYGRLCRLKKKNVLYLSERGVYIPSESLTELLNNLQSTTRLKS